MKVKRKRTKLVQHFLIILIEKEITLQPSLFKIIETRVYTCKLPEL